MTDTRVTGLTENTAPILTDVMYIIDDPGGSPASQKVTLTNLLKLINVDGWVPSAYTWVYASADDPTFTFTVAGVDLTAKYYPGMRLKLTQSTGGTKYFIVTKTAFSTNTTITVYGGTDYNLENETISSPYYSTAKAPAGFPLDPTKWMVEVMNTSFNTQANPAQNTWYNLGSITITFPIGAWKIQKKTMASAGDSVEGSIVVFSTLSTANNSESDTQFTDVDSINPGTFINSQHFCEKVLMLTSKTAYYLNAKTSHASADSLYLRGDLSPIILRAVSAYL
jgi:hypothetical protein